jgi:hypothetical protein
MEEAVASLPNGHSQKTYPERKCAKCRSPFQPLTALERRCTSCSAAASLPPKSARGKKAPAKLRAKPARGAVVVELPSAASPSAADWTAKHKPLGAPSKSGALKPSQIATAAELLELAGYKVVAVHTPAGEFLRVLE